jgi:glycerol kinase
MGFWDSQEEIAAQWKAERRFEPAITPDQRRERMARWHQAVERSRGWAV